MHSPLLSVIIPTHNRCDLLIRNLLAFSSQVEANPKFEVLVVADACEDGTEEKVLNFAKQAPYTIRLLRHSARNAAKTRNLGAAYATGKVLLFLDDDVLAEPGLVRAHMEAQGQNRVVFGYSKPTVPEKPSWWQNNARLWWEDVYTAMRQPDHRFSYRDFFSGNVSMPAELFQSMGGFDTSMTGRLEDYELGMRLLKAGARFCFVPEAVGYHHDQTDLALWLRRIRLEGVADVQIGERHPELRTKLFAEYAGRSDSWGKIRRMIRKVAFSYPCRGNRLEHLLLSLATFSERRRLRGFWLYVTAALREYNYWRGVATEIKGRKALTAWLQEAPVPPACTKDTPVVDLSALPENRTLQETLERASNLGLRLAVGGVEVLTLPSQPGLEPLREEHLWGALQELASKQFVPALAFQLILLDGGEGVPCSSSFVK